LFKAIGRNKFKTSLIVTLIFIFLSVVVYYFALYFGVSISAAATIAIAFSLLISLISYWQSDKIVLRMSGARPADKADEQYLRNILEGLVIAAGIPMPKLYVVEDATPNAFATGRNPQNAVICVTTGLLKRLDYYQLEGVLAHELAHVRNYDMLLQTVASVMIGAAIMLANIFSRSLFYGRRRSNSKGGGILVIIGLIFVILAPLAGQLMKMALSRNREYLADATAIQFTRNPEGLATALECISGLQPKKISGQAALEGLYIASPAKLLSTHPPIEKRVKAIRNII